ncbi:MAG: MFS transporter [Armatimonadota bacterium]|nr:MFS transporter [Armatimonadota bacterium]MDW8156934.1 MFS transporter [Armatimonadota bacterium]
MHPSPTAVLVLLIVGHAAVDVGAGALPALAQYLRTELRLTYTLTGAMVTAASLCGALVQVTAGWAADRRPSLWMVPAGVALTSAGLALAGFATGPLSAAAALAVLALGPALFHPEAVRTAYQAAGERRATMMGYFTVGGSVGWALGPTVVAVLAGAFGLRGLSLWLLVGLPVAALLLAFGSRPQAFRQGEADSRGGQDLWVAYGVLLAIALLRGGVHVGVTVFYPGYLIDHLGQTREAASASLSLLLAGGVVAAPVLGRLADRWSRRGVLGGTMAVLAAVVLLLPLLRPPWTYPAVLVLGACSQGVLPITLVLSQELLPGHTALGGGMQVAASSVAALTATPFGLVADAWGVPAVLRVASALAVVGAVLAAWLPTARPQRTEMLTAGGK